MDERDGAVAGGAADHPVGFDGICPIQEVVHETRRLHEDEADAAVADGGFALPVPHAGADAVGDVIGGQLRCRDVAEVYEYVTATLGRVGGVDRIEVSTVSRTIKHARTITDEAWLAR